MEDIGVEARLSRYIVYGYGLHNCMDVSEGRKALQHRQAMSIHERKLVSLSLRAGFHMHTHTHMRTCLHRHTSNPRYRTVYKS